MSRRHALLGVATALLVAVGAAGRAGGQVRDPTGTGPLAVTSAEYKFTGLLVPGIAYPVDVWAVTWYPTDISGGPFPLVLFLHGNHGICRSGGFDDCSVDPPICGPGSVPTPNHRGYDYIAEQLASWGYVVASINANAINCRDGGIPERGRLVQEHLRRWIAWNQPGGAAPFGTLFSGRVDLERVGLMGHSRGGEGVRAAYQYNLAGGSPVAIRAVFEIGPVDFGVFGINPIFDANDVSFSVLLPYCDSDVSDLDGMRVYDRSQRYLEVEPKPKAQQMIWGANHNFFNSEWDDEAGTCIDQIRLTREQEEQVGRTYVMGFMRTHLGEENFVDLFTRDLPPPPTIVGRVDNAYTEGRSDLLFVTDFSSSAAGAFTATNCLAQRCDGGSCGLGFGHDLSQHALYVSWSPGGPTPRVALDVRPGGLALDVSGQSFLSFRVALPDDGRNPPIPVGQDFTVFLRDEHGATSAGVRAGEFTYVHQPIGAFARIAVMESVRIPLDRFAGIDRTSVRSITLALDQEPAGSLFLSDFSFGPPPRRSVDDVACASARSSAYSIPGFAPLPPVHALGEFTDASFIARRPIALCNPTAVDGHAMRNPEVFLEHYQVKKAPGSPAFARQRFVRVDDALGQLVLDLVAPDSLLVPAVQDAPTPPSAQSPQGRDSFLCYTVKPSAGSLPFPRDLTVSVEDAFTSPPKVLSVRKPSHLCVPVGLDGEQRRDPDLHIVCYAVRLGAGAPRRATRRGVYVHNPLSFDRVDTRREEELCMVSRRVP